jgi:hypothetical protein
MARAIHQKKLKEFAASRRLYLQLTVRQRLRIHSICEAVMTL